MTIISKVTRQFTSGGPGALPVASSVLTQVPPGIIPSVNAVAFYATTFSLTIPIMAAGGGNFQSQAVTVSSVGLISSGNWPGGISVAQGQSLIVVPSVYLITTPGANLVPADFSLAPAGGSLIYQGPTTVNNVSFTVGVTNTAVGATTSQMLTYQFTAIAIMGTHQ